MPPYVTGCRGADGGLNFNSGLLPASDPLKSESTMHQFTFSETHFMLQCPSTVSVVQYNHIAPNECLHHSLAAPNREVQHTVGPVPLVEHESHLSRNGTISWQPR
eukprot:GHUV01031700.1.p2 GENE.GHUV01031700.1~~GHUV01031700.1.p2  ORF type:complete len:105 (-),score=3.55 GHUV01031700.1:1215-1529(-)